MPSIINSDDGVISGTSGLKTTGGNDGALNIQANGTTAIAISSTGTVTMPAGALPVASGGTGSTSLTSNNVLLGNGTSAVQTVAPGANGNILTSNGTTWVSSTPAAGGVTSVSTGTGLTGGPITSTGTISLANTAVAAGSYTNTNLTVDAQGRITAASNGSSGGVTSLNGQTGAVVTTDLEGIGAVTSAFYGITSTATTGGRFSYITRGTTVAGSSIRIGNLTTANNSATPATSNQFAGSVSNSTTAFPTSNTTTLTGTWRFLSGTNWTNAISTGCPPVTYYWYQMLWVRIS